MSPMIPRIAMILALGAVLLSPAASELGASSGIAHAADEARLDCSCRSCDPDVCCTTPSGFEPLDQKCALKCTTKRWTVASYQNCSPQAGCCPPKKAPPRADAQ